MLIWYTVNSNLWIHHDIIIPYLKELSQLFRAKYSCAKYQTTIFDLFDNLLMFRSKNYALKRILLIFGAFFTDQKSFFSKTSNHQLWIIHFFSQKLTEKLAKNSFLTATFALINLFPSKQEKLKAFSDHFCIKVMFYRQKMTYNPQRSN